MSTYLLDVNVLLALFDPTHVFSDAAHHWFAVTGRSGWATCAITENGFVRISSHPGYPNSIGDLLAVLENLARFCDADNHYFWSSDVTIRNVLRPGAVITHSQVTEVYLLRLAASKGGKLATFDRKIPAVAVYGGREALAVIPV